jgi:MFS family permease
MEGLLAILRGKERIKYLVAEYPRQFWVLFGGMLISSIGGSMVWPFLTIYMRQRLDVPLTTVGLLLSLNSGAGLATTFVAGPVADRFGRKGVMVLSLLANCVIYVAMIPAAGLPLWAILVTLMGAFGPLFRVGSNAMVADLIGPDQRPSAYALLRMGNNLGIAIGPAIGGFVAAVSYARTFLIASAASAAFSLLILFLVQETLPLADSTPEGRPSTSGYGRLLHDRVFLAFCGISALAVIPAAMMMVLLPVYAKEQFDVIESQYGFIMATNAAMVVLFQYMVTQVTKRYPHWPVLAVGALFYGLGTGSVALGQGFAAFLVSMIVMTIGELILVPTGTTLAANLSPADMRGRYMGVYGLTWGVGMGIGPVIGGALNDQIAPAAIWFGALLFGLAATLGFLFLSRARQESVEIAPANP